MKFPTEDYVNRHIGSRIKRAREDRKLSPAELGDKIGKSESTIFRWENGSVPVSGWNMVALSLALDVTAPYFLLGLEL